ncbi:MAG: hypothetical protein FJY54_05305 [Betaproteobacteria bacterium]|nr:hypothetical protein [Betaproteobacteria bacterium]
MKLASFEALVAALETARVRYLVAGGLAVSAHGHLRFTHDVDLVVRFVSIPTLIAIKEVANRPIDGDDIQHLRWIMEEKKRGRSDT